VNQDLRAVVCYGDSNTWGSDPGTGLRFPHELRWTSVVGHELGPTFDVIAEGLGGRTAGFDDPTGPGRNGRTHLLACLWSHAPLDAVVVMLGTNDLKSFFNASAAEIALGIEMLIVMITESVVGPAGSSPRILVVAPPPLGKLPSEARGWGFAGRRGESRLLARAIGTVAERQGAMFLDAGTIIESSPLDGVHLDADAHRTLGIEIARRLRD
jgi:lysophospholipase L1-like esterase